MFKHKLGWRAWRAYALPMEKLQAGSYIYARRLLRVRVPFIIFTASERPCVGEEG